jgi:hypothetical protein
MHRTRSFKRTVYKHVGKFKTLRSLVKAYGFLTGDVVRSQNRLKAAYRSEGISTTGSSVYDEEEQDEWLEKLDEPLRAAAGTLHSSSNALDGLKSEAEQALVKEASKHKAFRLIQTIPGFGPIRAAQLLSVVVTPHRFRTKRQFWSYCGFAIVTQTSSDWVPQTGGGWTRKKIQQTRGLNRNHNQVLKNVFKGAAMTVVAQMPSSPLHADYEKMLANGTKPNLAMLTVARKIASIALAVWKSNTPYDPTRPRTGGKKEEEKKNVDREATSS